MIAAILTCLQCVAQPAGSQENGAGSAVRPFEAQLAAARDRRSIGLYDARFHSTNWCGSTGHKINQFKQKTQGHAIARRGRAALTQQVL